jgi:hypothetical protein
MKVIGAVLIILALIVAIAPMLTDCQSQGKSIVLENGKTVAMKCHWSGVAELVVAVPLLVLGVMEMVNRNSLVNRYLSILGIIFGIFIILIPTNLIGVCVNPEMICSSVMRPILLLCGVLVIVASSIGLWISFKSQDKPV